MNSLIDAIFKLSWQDWATIVGGLFGVIGVVAYIEQKRAARGQEAVLKFVDRHVAKDISEETIKALERQRSAMELQVSQNIPALARAAVLKEQAEAHAAALSQHFSEWKRIQEELKPSPTGGELDPAIEQIIVDRLAPKYERESALDAVRSRITALSVSLALASSLFPFPVNTIIISFLAVPLLSSLAELVRLSSKPDQWATVKRLVLWSVYSVLLISILGFDAVLIALWGEGLTEFGKMSIFVLSFLGLAGLAFFPLVRKRINRNIGVPDLSGTGP